MLHYNPLMGTARHDTERVLQEALGEALRHDEPMARHTTLKVGGPARWFWAASEVETLAQILAVCTRHEIPYLFVGHGSNLLMSDAGYDGLVIQNRCKGCAVGEETYAESGVSFGSLFLQTARAGFCGSGMGHRHPRHGRRGFGQQCRGVPGQHRAVGGLGARLHRRAGPDRRAKNGWSSRIGTAACAAMGWDGR